MNIRTKSALLWLLSFTPFFIVSGLYIWGIFYAPELPGKLKWTLMLSLVLAVAILAKFEKPLYPILLALGLILSWLGDVYIDISFIYGLIFFLCAHLAYITLFLIITKGRINFWGILMILPITMLLWLLWPHAGDMLIPIIAYGVIIGFMGVTAINVSWIALAGALFFIVSDSILAINRFTDIAIWQSGFLVMFTYLSAQFLITFAVLRINHRSVAAA